MKCEKCNQNFKTLTKESLCAFCYKKKYGKWSNEFSNEKDKKKKNG